MARRAGSLALLLSALALLGQALRTGTLQWLVPSGFLLAAWLYDLSYHDEYERRGLLFFLDIRLIVMFVGVLTAAFLLVILLALALITVYRR